MFCVQTMFQPQRIARHCKTTEKKEKGDKRVNKGYCHITFESIFSAAKAVKQDGTTILGRRARIDFAAEEALEDRDDRTQKRARSE